MSLDSRRVAQNDLYVAIPGHSTDGSRFASAALDAGARAILAPLANADLDSAVARSGAPLWLHPQARGLAGRVASELYGNPSHELTVVAITGTNGKTTTAALVHDLWTSCGKRSGVLGTVGNRLAGDRFEAATHTTPDGPGLQALLAQHVRLGGDSIVMEVSSHALDQERIAGVEIDVAIFTNLGRDHLDYHGTIDQYASAKALLFTALDHNSSAVINADDPHHQVMVAAAAKKHARIITFGVATNGTAHVADLSASQLVTDLQGTLLTLSGMGFSGVELRLPLLGRHNVENALAATAAVLTSGASPSALAEGLAAVSAPPGRLERVGESANGGRSPAVFVDYAHTPDALVRVLDVLRDALPTGGRLFVVFGCGGDRDRGKRPLMGRAAASRADVVVVTSDNPRSEDPSAICDAVAEGARGTSAELHVEVDRRAAIRLALSSARSGDVVLVAGKGHETTQTIGSEVLPFSDREVVLEELS
ncbi:MAG: UDP-N-acetylmuramoyl-L-alanyl-D-glutamate--2,6-diaminopimelate ligase [Planctomycetes bacterium]|nr:UDP-N-acetylmuramoyl-L-alanyl-D-glutamate--2,6-diaminopimelate ligase [Planctomycetota bacterium]